MKLLDRERKSLKKKETVEGAPRSEQQEKQGPEVLQAPEQVSTAVCAG